MHTRQFTVTGNITKTITGSNVTIKGGTAIVAKADLMARDRVRINTKWIPIKKLQKDIEIG